MNLSDLFSDPETKMQAINRPSYGLEFSGRSQQQPQQQHVQPTTRQEAFYQPAHVASSMSTSALNLDQAMPTISNFEAQNAQQAHPHQISTTRAAGLDTVPQTTSHDFDDLHAIVNSSVYNNIDLQNDPALNGMFGGVGGGGASLFDGGRINEWNTTGQDWSDILGNVDETVIQGQTGHSSGSGVDMFGGLFFG